MESLSKLSRRGLVKFGAISAGIAPFSQGFVSRASAQDAGSEAGRIGVVGGRAEEELYPGKGLPGGGQLEIRLSASIYTSDADQLEVAQRMKPFNLASWIEEWTRVAERNEKLAEKFAGEGFKVTANEYYSRASNFYREACWPMPVTESRMLPLYKKMRETFDKAWQQTRPPFERVQVSYEGQMLDGYFRKPNGPAGKKFPTLIAFQGADTMAEATILNGGAYITRGMAYLALDFPGQGGALRLEGSASAAGYGTNREGDDRLSGDASGRGRESHRDAGHQHGRLRRAARGERRIAHCSGADEQRIVRFGTRSVRLLSTDSGAGALDHRGTRPDGRAQEALRIHAGGPGQPHRMPDVGRL